MVLDARASSLGLFTAGSLNLDGFSKVNAERDGCSGVYEGHRCDADQVRLMNVSSHERYTEHETVRRRARTGWQLVN